ncbi:dienelactone hydrolase family protein [Bradyrhizobium sp. sGM-13]|uniref:dienelactone hydrolase family protein n=1 Tax=Bradyrhizobium sp. sGM-13 TaxID=2831781 RepID=UPI002811D292|nr:dienelactone hydrolase family protein [Bradyrhizobium sp. sGM-13]
MKLAKIAFAAALLIGSAANCFAADKSPIVVEIESPLASPHPLQGYLRQTTDAGPSPAVILLHSCNGNWQRTDERWGKRITEWGYVTLTVDSLGPRGIDSCHRALKFLVRLPSVDPARVAVLGFARGGATALRAVEHGPFEKTSPNKFGAAIAFYPPCSSFKGYMTAPTLILIGELDDWTPAEECRNMVDGQDAWGISRQERGAPVKLIVYPGAYHAFDAPGPKNPIEGHHLEFNQSATDQSSEALREFLGATIGAKEQLP